ncbi:MAG: hypothetical protein H3C54_07425 [Taibaiella sp.]|nr:hypothetical protein [Taibaiella sp.]
MNITDFKRIVTSFADNANDVEISKGQLTAIIRNEAISAQIKEIDANLFVIEDDEVFKSIDWIANRLANLEQLANRITTYIEPIPNFIDSTGQLLDDINIDPTESLRTTTNVTEILSDKLSDTIPGTTQVTYLTSDAGEGKTTIINHLARSVASEYIHKRKKWLLVPIPLGGRPFLRFDDIVVASFVNRLRFRFFYYESFLELVKLGLIVPAFDGFEEMFMEGSSGEALSATGQLMSKLESNGKVLIAARKAYFDYKDFSAQAKLFDTIGTNSVSFIKIVINRWDKEQFLLYCYGRNIEQAEEIYELISNKLGSENHPLLTRPVLVKQLLDAIANPEELKQFSAYFDSAADYFPKFVTAIIKREAESKWIDRSGEQSKPLLTVEQHYELLALIAEEMWLNSTDALQGSILDFISELYCETNKLGSSTSHQVKERLKQHALIVKSEFSNNSYKFDHEEFKEFFLGISISKLLIDGKIYDVKNLLRKGTLFKQSIEAIVSELKKKYVQINGIINILMQIQFGEGTVSYIRENNGGIIIKLLDNAVLEDYIVENCIMPDNSLYNIHLNNVVFKRCHFQSTSILSSEMNNCLFDNCTFDGISFDETLCCMNNVSLNECTIGYVQNEKTDNTYYSPYDINNILKKLGIHIQDKGSLENIDNTKEVDKDLLITERALRKFMRTTSVNDNIFRVRLGGSADHFFKSILPLLIDSKIVNEVEYLGSGTQKRYRLNVPFDKINYAFTNCDGTLNDFVKIVNKQ